MTISPRAKAATAAWMRCWAASIFLKAFFAHSR
jgi:hypothetical protein